MSLENSERVMSTAVNERLYSSDYERENKLNNVTSPLPLQNYTSALGWVLYLTQSGNCEKTYPGS